MTLLRFLGATFFCAFVTAFGASAGNRLTYLDESDPFYVNGSFPRLTTPQWIGETNVEAAVILAIDDMRAPQKYEEFLRPLLDRLKKIDGRSSASIFCNALDANHPKLREWLKEGVSLEVHTLVHPCPLLAKSNFVAAAETYHQCVDLLNAVPENVPHAFRMPCCDSINSPSPRFYAEMFNQLTPQKHFLTIDSSVMNISTPKDPAYPKEWALDADGREKFRKYLPFPSFVTTIEDYPYPYVIGDLCWEFPAMVPSDWEAQHIHGITNKVSVADWKSALDITVRKQGLFTFIFHPHGWIRPDQLVEFIDYAVEKHGKKVKFINFREAEELLSKNLLKGEHLRTPVGGDAGVRLLDLDHDGFLDVVCGNPASRFARTWNPALRQWREFDQPFAVTRTSGVRFGVVGTQNTTFALVKSEKNSEAWHFEAKGWQSAPELLKGIEGLSTIRNGSDSGLRVRDLDEDGNPEILVANADQNLAFTWSEQDRLWKKLSYALPPGMRIVDGAGQDNGLRFVDLNSDGFADAIQSNPEGYKLNLFVPKLVLGFQPGWSRDVLVGKRETGEIPMIVRGGEHPNNGAWFHSGQLWVQNEETAHLPDLVDRRPFGALLSGARPKAKSPTESLRSMRVRPGFKIELVAQEPLVKDPVAFDWSPDGKLWVVEMGDYPLGIDGHGKPGGLVRFLEDTNGDGIYDKSTVFMQNVGFPNGVLSWRKGVLISAAPEIFYAEDRDGDGKADLFQTLFSGFVEGNQQHRLNGFDYGLDGWIYGANGDSGGVVRAGSSSKTVDLRGHDFRFRPDELLFEAIEGQTQFGRHRDDWGTWFGNNNPTWLWYYTAPESYLKRNPHLAVRSLKQHLANYPESTRVFPASRQLQRFNDIGMAGHVTSGNSPTPYRDNLFGADFESSIFISEPVHNVVHREVLEDVGASYTSRRATGEESSEFLASEDNWFRPTMMRTGPDGALYIADMYRFVLEHPEWIPRDTQASLDLRAGSDMGRIYRIYPEAATLRNMPRLDRATAAELAQALESPNGWTRDTAQRLLLERQDKSAIPGIRAVALSGSSPKARLQALWTLEEFDALDAKSLVSGLRDANAHVRRHSVRLTEGKASDPEIARALLQLVDDRDEKVRQQLAFSLGEWKDPRAATALVRLIERDWKTEIIQTAILSSMLPHLKEVSTALLARNTPAEPLAAMVRLALREKSEETLGPLLRRKTLGNRLSEVEGSLYAAFFQELRRMNLSYKDFEQRSTPALQSILTEVRKVFSDLEQQVAAQEKPEALIPLIASDPDSQRAGRILLSFLDSRFDANSQEKALGAMRSMNDPRIAGAVLQKWKSLGPVARNAALTLFTSRPEWSEALLSALDEKQLSAAEIPVNLQQTLRSSKNIRIRDHAEALFTRPSDRQKLLDERMAFAGKTGNPEKGFQIFRQACATCHKLRGEGFLVGPELGMVAEKPDRILLEAILDPNRAFESRYEGYEAADKNGQQSNGVITAETATSVTLRNANGIEQTLLRKDLLNLNPTGRSLMPEGFETALSDQDLADLVSAVRAR